MVALGVVVARAEERRRGDRAKRRRIALAATFALAGVWGLALVGATWAVGHTLEADFVRAKANFQAHDPHAAAELEAAIVRHPANGRLELLAAREALASGAHTALHHLNRALRLEPASWEAHRLAARTLARLGKPAQAALEYRLALEHGMVPSYDEMLRVAGDHAIDAVPQRSEHLLELATQLVQRGRSQEAAQVGARAIERASRVEPVLKQLLQLALLSRRSDQIVAAADAYLEARPEASGYEEVAQAFQTIGDVTRSNQVIDLGVKAHPEESSLVLAGARMRLQRGDLAGARTLLRRSSDGSFSLRDRQEAEELLAQIAERSGDADAAVLARARARSYARRRQEASQVE
jgi:hypothetical protein